MTCHGPTNIQLRFAAHFSRYCGRASGAPWHMRAVCLPLSCANWRTICRSFRMAGQYGAWPATGKTRRAASRPTGRWRYARLRRRQPCCSSIPSGPAQVWTAYTAPRAKWRKTSCLRQQRRWPRGASPNAPRAHTAIMRSARSGSGVGTWGCRRGPRSTSRVVCSTAGRTRDRCCICWACGRRPSRTKPRQRRSSIHPSCSSNDFWGRRR